MQHKAVRILFRFQIQSFSWTYGYRKGICIFLWKYPDFWNERAHLLLLQQELHQCLSESRNLLRRCCHFSNKIAVSDLLQIYIYLWKNKNFTYFFIDKNKKPSDIARRHASGFIGYPLKTESSVICGGAFGFLNPVCLIFRNKTLIFAFKRKTFNRFFYGNP